VKDQVYKQLLDDVYRTGNRFVSPELPSPFIVKVMEVFVNLYMSHCVKPMELFWRDGVVRRNNRSGKCPEKLLK
jgi:hypothetical protein